MGKRFPPFRSCVPSLQPPAWGVFGLTSERKASFRSNTGAGEASRTQAGRRTPLPTWSWAALLLDSPAPGVFSSVLILLSPPALLLHTAEKESAERVASLGPSQGVTGDGAGTGTRLGKTADPRGDDRAGLGSCFGPWLVGLNLACSLSPSPVSAGRRSHPFLQVRLPTCWWNSSPPPPAAPHSRSPIRCPSQREACQPSWAKPTVVVSRFSRSGKFPKQQQEGPGGLHTWTDPPQEPPSCPPSGCCPCFLWSR